MVLYLKVEVFVLTFNMVLLWNSIFTSIFIGNHQSKVQIYASLWIMWRWTINSKNQFGLLKQKLLKHSVKQIQSMYKKVREMMLKYFQQKWIYFFSQFAF